MNDSTGTALERTAPATLEQVRNTQVALDPAVVLTRAELNFFADMVVMADLIPFDRNTSKEVQKFRVMSKIVAGAAHRFDPISSQENLHVIQGRVVLSARGMAIKLRRTGRYDTRVEKLDETGCKLAVLEKDNTGKWILKGHVEFNREHADKAGLLKSNSAMYDKWGEDMFYANAIKRVCRRFAPEVLDTEPMDYRLSKESAAADAQAFQPAPAPVHQIAAPAEPEQTGPEPPDEPELPSPTRSAVNTSTRNISLKRLRPLPTRSRASLSRPRPAKPSRKKLTPRRSRTKRSRSSSIYGNTSRKCFRRLPRNVRRISSPANRRSAKWMQISWQR
jgi:hypothetical protein